MNDRNKQIVDANKKPNQRERYLAFKSIADEHFGGLDKSITEYIEGLEDTRRLDNKIITELYEDNQVLLRLISTMFWERAKVDCCDTCWPDGCGRDECMGTRYCVYEDARVEIERITGFKIKELVLDTAKQDAERNP